jgi:hypothetical protein
MHTPRTLSISPTASSITRARAIWRARLGVALATSLIGLGATNAFAQSGAAAAAEGRPAMAGAQGGMGAQPGLQQGGLGNKAPNNAGQVEIPLKRPGTQPMEKAVGPREVRMAVRTGSDLRVPDESQAAPKRTEEVKPTEGTARKAARATKRSMDRARTGVSPVDANGTTGVGGIAKP